MTQAPPTRLDRPSESAEATRIQETPWQVQGRRGALNLGGDSAGHRRSQSLFEDLMN